MIYFIERKIAANLRAVEFSSCEAINPWIVPFDLKNKRVQADENDFSRGYKESLISAVYFTPWLALLKSG